MDIITFDENMDINENIDAMSWEDINDESTDEPHFEKKNELPYNIHILYNMEYINKQIERETKICVMCDKRESMINTNICIICGECEMCGKLRNKFDYKYCNDCTEKLIKCKECGKIMSYIKMKKSLCVICKDEKKQMEDAIKQSEIEFEVSIQKIETKSKHESKIDQLIIKKEKKADDIINGYNNKNISGERFYVMCMLYYDARYDIELDILYEEHKKKFSDFSYIYNYYNFNHNEATPFTSIMMPSKLDQELYLLDNFDLKTDYYKSKKCNEAFRIVYDYIINFDKNVINTFLLILKRKNIMLPLYIKDIIIFCATGYNRYVSTIKYVERMCDYTCNSLILRTAVTYKKITHLKQQLQK